MRDLFFETETARCAELMRCRVELAKRQALAPLRPRVLQSACDVGLFSDAVLQIDLVERCK
jgi:hypothetical protein